MDLFYDPIYSHRRLCILANRIAEFGQSTFYEDWYSHTFNTALGPRTIVVSHYNSDGETIYELSYENNGKTLFRIEHTNDITFVDNNCKMTEEEIKLAIYEIECIVDNILKEKNKEVVDE